MRHLSLTAASVEGFFKDKMQRYQMNSRRVHRDFNSIRIMTVDVEEAEVTFILKTETSLQ